MTIQFSGLRRLCLAAGISVIAACAAVAAEDEDSFSAPDRSVTLEAPNRARLGIVTMAATARAVRTQARGLGQVIGLDTLAQTDAELSVAEAAARASQAALVRAQNMFKADTGISRQALETAEHQAATDGAQLALAQRKATAAWGRGAPWRDADQRRALMAKLASGAAVIVRATFPTAIGDGGAQPQMRIERLGAAGADKEAKGWAVKSLWPAPADPAAPGHGYYLLAEGANDLADGERVRVVAASGEAKQGAYVPAGAVILAEGTTWLYIEEKPNYFVRQSADISQPAGEGYVLLHGVQPGEKIVTSGAAHLLARETGTEE